MQKFLYLVIASIFIVSCTAHESKSPEENTSKEAGNDRVRKDLAQNSREFKSGENFDYSANYSKAKSSREPQLLENRKLIWNADLKFQAKDVDKTAFAIRKLSDKHQGYVSDMKREGADDLVSMNLTIRVKSSHFQDLVHEIKGESVHLDVADINSEDVSEEYVDIENRLQTKRAARERYIEILRTKTGTIEEVISAEDAIRRITEEIEAKEGRLRYLQDQLDFSTITIEIYSKPAVVEYADPTYGDQAKSAFSQGWDFIKGFGLVLVGMWPILLTLMLIGYFKRDWLREKFSRSKKNE